MRKRGLSFRHFRVGVLHREDNDRGTLQRQLARLGADVVCYEDFPPASDLKGVEAVFFDGDAALPCGIPAKPAWPDVPLIALIGSEAPSRLEWILAQDISAYLLKPVRTVGVLTALGVAQREYERRRAYCAAIDRLKEKLQGRRFVFSAQLALMRHHGIDEAEAFSRLRRLAMERQTTIEEISLDLISGSIAASRWGVT